MKKRLMVVDRCHVIRLNNVNDAGGQRVSEVVTERGPLPVSPDAKVIIALGTIESARLALLSFGGDGKTGRNLIAHLRSNVDIRVPRAALASLPAAGEGARSLGAVVKGQHQFKKPDGSPDGVRALPFSDHRIRVQRERHRFRGGAVQENPRYRHVRRAQERDRYSAS